MDNEASRLQRATPSIRAPRNHEKLTQNPLRRRVRAWLEEVEGDGDKFKLGGLFDFEIDS